MEGILFIYNRLWFDRYVLFWIRILEKFNIKVYLLDLDVCKIEEKK